MCPLRPRLHRSCSLLAWTTIGLFGFSLLSGLSECSTSDADGDGYTTQDGDCDDSDASINPGAAERCDGIDSDCYDADEPYATWYLDEDDDGWGDIVQSVESCSQPSGTTFRTGDCDDGDASRYPTHAEICNGLDENCDGIADNGLGERFYRDADGDGFGSMNDVSCGAKSGYSSVRGDCDDTRKDVYPGAADLNGDGRDQDCGGFDGPQPQLGFGKNPATSLQAALDSAQAGATIWVGPGTYTSINTLFPSINLRLMSTHGRNFTVFDAQKKGRILSIIAGNSSSSLVDGFTIQNGSMVGEDGGGLLIENSSPVLQNLAFQSNQTSGVTGLLYVGNGGALALKQSDAQLHSVTFHQNSALSPLPPSEQTGGWGGALYVEGGHPILSELEASKNNAVKGGAVFGTETHLELRSVQLSQNTASGGAEAFYIQLTELELYDAEISDHTDPGTDVAYADWSKSWIADLNFHNNAGAMMLRDGMARVTDSTFQDNSHSVLFMNVGYAINDVQYPYSLLRNSVMLNNVESIDGSSGALWIDGYVRVEYNSFVGNSDAEGGCIYIAGGSALLDSNIFAYNVGYDVQVGVASPPFMSFNNFYNLTSEISPSLLEMDTSNTHLEPRLVTWANNNTLNSVDVHLLPDSPLLNTGNLAYTDADGSRSQPGAYGADALADLYTRDADLDGMYDGWETQHQLNPNLNDGGQDLDGDGAKNLTEFMAGLDPSNPDCDRDGQKDGTELNAGSDALDWYQRVAANGSGLVQVVAQVPGDFSLPQAAVDAIRFRGELTLAAQTWGGPLKVFGKQAVIHADGATITKVDSTTGTLLQSRFSTLDITGLTLKGGYNTTRSGGFTIAGGEVTLNKVSIIECSAEVPAGGIANRSSLNFTGVSFLRNLARGYQGGLKLDDSTLIFDDLQFLDNSGNNFEIAGSFINGQFLSIEGVLDGCGFAAASSEIEVKYCRVMNNYSNDYEAGVVANDSNLSLSHCVITGNQSGGSNDAGVRISGSPVNTFTLDHSIVAYNSHSNLLVAGPVASISTTNFYNPPGMDNTTGVPPSNTVTSVEPKFLGYNTSGLPSDFHLAFDSPLINAGATGQADADGSRADLGIYGGADGDLWDRDADSFEDYFWPGTRAQAPKGFTATDWDLNDGDATIH